MALVVDMKKQLAKVTRGARAKSQTSGLLTGW